MFREIMYPSSGENTVPICAPSGFYLQDYTGMHGQQNIKISHVRVYGRLFVLRLVLSHLKKETNVCEKLCCVIQ